MRVNIAAGTIAGNPAIDQLIHQNLEVFPNDLRAKLVNDLLTKAGAKNVDNALHTVHELLIGAQLVRSMGCAVEYERRFERPSHRAPLTPDWALLDGSRPTGIVEVSNYRLRKAKEDDLEAHMSKPHWSTNLESRNFLLDLVTKSPEDRQLELEVNGALVDDAIYLYWSDETDDDFKLNRALSEKTLKYSEVVKAHRLPFVVAVFSLFPTAVDLEDIIRAAEPLLPELPCLSGIWFARELSAGRFKFDYVQNPTAIFQFTLPSTEWQQS